MVLDMDSSENPVYGEQEQSAYNGYFESVCYHPLFLFDPQGDCLAAKLRPGTRQQVRLEPVQGGGQSYTPLPDLLRAHQPEGRIVRQPCGIVQVFISSQPAVGGLPGQIRQGKLCIAPRAAIHQVILNESCQAEAFIEFANEQQTAIRSHPRSLKIDAQKPVERELKGLILALPAGRDPPPEGFPVLGSRVNTGDPYLVHPYHEVSNRKSGLKGEAENSRSSKEYPIRLRVNVTSH